MGWEQYPPHTRLPFSWFSNRQKSPIKIARYKRIKIAAYKEYWFLIFFNFSILQEAVFDKNKGTVCLKTFNLYKKMLTFSKGGSEQGEEAVSVIATVIGRQKKTPRVYCCFVLFSLKSSVLKLGTLVSRSILFTSSKSNKLPFRLCMFLQAEVLNAPC